jgi:hypothetical protein
MTTDRELLRTYYFPKGHGLCPLTSILDRLGDGPGIPVVRETLAAEICRAGAPDLVKHQYDIDNLEGLWVLESPQYEIFRTVYESPASLLDTMLESVMYPLLDKLGQYIAFEPLDEAVQSEPPVDPHEGIVNTYQGGVIVNEHDEDIITLEYTKPDGTRVIHPDWNDCVYIDAKATPLDTARAINELLSRRGADFRIADIDDGSDTYIFITESK